MATQVKTVEERLAAIEATLPHLATKADLYKTTGAMVVTIVVAMAAIVRFLS